MIFASYLCGMLLCLLTLDAFILTDMYDKSRVHIKNLHAFINNEAKMDTNIATAALGIYHTCLSI